MAVEKLTVIEGPMGAIEENGGFTGWMQSKGISPGAVALGALAGAAFAQGDMLKGAAKWALLFGAGSWVWNKYRNDLEPNLDI